MNQQPEMIEQLQSMTSLLEQERAGISIVGRALTEQETHRLKQIEGALPLLQGAVEKLTAEPGFIP